MLGETPQNVVARGRLLLLFPGALGDFLCFLPTAMGLRQAHGETLLVANAAAVELVENGPFRTASIDRSEVADLFAGGPPSASARSLFAGFAVAHSWTGHGAPELATRLAAITGGTVRVHRFRGMHAGEHAIDYYARCAGVPPAPAAVWTTAADQAWAEEWCRANLGGAASIIVVHPGSGSPRKSWDGFPDLVRELRVRAPARNAAVAVVLGPAEMERGTRAPDGVAAIRGVSLRRVAALLQRAALYVGNDAGISHLAAVVGAPTLALFGPSDPALWAPRGRSVEVISAPTPCSRCGADRFCRHRLAPQAVLAAVERMIPELMRV